MKPTPDRLAVARAVLLDCIERWDLPRAIINDMGDEESDLREVIAALPEPPDDSPATLPAPTGPGWPDWLSPEYQAIVKMVKDAMRRAEDDICNSEDASGLPRTAEGERNVYAGAIVHAFKCAGWMPPLVALTAKGEE